MKSIDVMKGNYLDFLVIEIDGTFYNIESVEYIRPIYPHRCIIKVNDVVICIISEETFDLIEEDMGK